MRVIQLSCCEILEREIEARQTQQGTLGVMDVEQIQQLENEMNELKESYQYLRTYTKAKRVCTACCSFDNEHRFALLGMHPFDLPMENGKIISCYTLETRNLTRADFWKFELTASIISSNRRSIRIPTR